VPSMIPTFPPTIRPSGARLDDGHGHRRVDR
jgi:hypothetical protein